MNTNIVELEKIAKSANEEFIRARSQRETMLDDMRNRLMELSDEYKKKLNIDIELISSQNLFPSLYKDKFDKEQFDKEQELYDKNIVAPINALRESILKEAEVLINEYRA